ncbi:MAG: DUF370 domain-containing protein [Clostridiales bacterium]|nr:DUF370 domain-containing protein [Candidatus Scatonaster coprocaballi]
MAFVDIGFGNMVASGRLVCVAGADSAPIRRLVQDARDRGALVDCSSGKKSKAVLVTDSGHIVLSALTPEEISTALSKAQDEGKETEHE